MPKGIPGSKAPHGTITRYTRHRCRCDDCRCAATKDRRERAGSVSWQEWIASLPPVQHGTETMYARGCRCDDCKRASREARTRRRKQVAA